MTPTYQDWHAQQAWKHYLRELRWLAFRRIMVDLILPCIAIALVIYLNWRLP